MEKTNKLSDGNAAFVAGIANLIMAFTGPFADFGKFPKLYSQDPKEITGKLSNNETLFTVATFLNFISIFCLMFLLTTTCIQAQTNNVNGTGREYESIFDDDPEIRVSGFFGVLNDFSAVDGEFGHFFGLGGAVTINDMFLGAYVKGLTNSIEAREPVSGRYVQLDHGGFWLGYSLFANSVVHPAFHVKAGWGNLRAANNTGFQTSGSKESNNVFVLSPAVDVELNLTRFIRLGVGVGYNWTSQVELGGYSNKDFSSPDGHIFLKIGKFSK